MDGAAPGRDTAMAAAFAAWSRAVFGSSPYIRPPMKNPVNVSPAAVVSTTGTR